MTKRSQTVADLTIDAMGLQLAPACIVATARFRGKQPTLTRNEWVRTLVCLLVLLTFLPFVASYPEFLLKLTTIALTVIGCYLVMWLTSGNRLGLPAVLQYCILFAIFIPDSVPFYVVVLTCLFGAVFGDIVFGGRGYSFLHPVLCGLCFMLLGYPDLNPVVEPSYLHWIGLLIAASALFWFRCLDPRVLIPAVFSFAFLMLAKEGSNLSNLNSPLVAACILLLLSDPSVTPTTHLGRLVYGLFLGSLLYLLGVDGLLFNTVALSGFFISLLSPLIDWAAVRLPATVIQNQKWRVD